MMIMIMIIMTKSQNRKPSSAVLCYLTEEFLRIVVAAYETKEEKIPLSVAS